MTYCEYQKLHDEKCERCEHHGASGDEGKMSNENQETIADIVADIRAQNQGLPEDDYALSPLVCDLLSFADRIEAAATREREAGAATAQVCGEIGDMVGREAERRSYERTAEKYSAVGNAAAMRKALLETKSVIARCMEILNKIPGGVEYDGLIDDVADEICDLSECHVNPALSVPQRNCDVLSKDEVLETLKDRSFSKEDTIELLYGKE